MTDVHKKMTVAFARSTDHLPKLEDRPLGRKGGGRTAKAPIERPLYTPSWVIWERIKTGGDPLHRLRLLVNCLAFWTPNKTRQSYARHV